MQKAEQLLKGPEEPISLLSRELLQMLLLLIDKGPGEPFNLPSRELLQMLLLLIVKGPGEPINHLSRELQEMQGTESLGWQENHLNREHRENREQGKHKKEPGCWKKEDC
jgi:hypothetical protein